VKNPFFAVKKLRPATSKAEFEAEAKSLKSV